MFAQLFGTLGLRRSDSLMKPFYGTYLGFTPTDESAICVGEFEVTLNDAGLKIRFATGLTIQEESLSFSQLILMSQEEINHEYKDGSSLARQTVGLRTKSGLPKLLFLRDPQENEFGLVVRMGELSEILGPTLLYSPAQVAAGLFDQFLKTIEEDAGPNMFPRLANKGKA